MAVLPDICHRASILVLSNGSPLTNYGEDEDNDGSPLTTGGYNRRGGSLLMPFPHGYSECSEGSVPRVTKPRRSQILRRTSLELRQIDQKERFQIAILRQWCTTLLIGNLSLLRFRMEPRLQLRV